MIIINYGLIFFASIGATAFLFFLWYLFSKSLLKRRYKPENDRGKDGKGGVGLQSHSLGVRGRKETTERRDLEEATTIATSSDEHYTEQDSHNVEQQGLINSNIRSF